MNFNSKHTTVFHNCCVKTVSDSTDYSCKPDLLHVLESGLRVLTFITTHRLKHRNRGAN